MNRREKNLAIVTALVVVSLLGFNFLVPSLSEDGGDTGGGAGNVELAQRRLREFTETLRNSQDIERQYEQIEIAAPPTRPGYSAADTFSDELFGLVTNRLPIYAPDISAPTMSPIPGVEEYYFVDLEIRHLQGTREQMTSLLEEMRNVGLIIKSFTLQNTPRGREEELVELNVGVSRLVKHDEESRRRMRYMRF